MTRPHPLNAAPRKVRRPNGSLGFDRLPHPNRLQGASRTSDPAPRRDTQRILCWIVALAAFLGLMEVAWLMGLLNVEALRWVLEVLG